MGEVCVLVLRWIDAPVQVFNIFQIIFAVELHEFDRMIKGLKHGCFHIGTYIKPSVDISPRLRLGLMSSIA